MIIIPSNINTVCRALYILTGVIVSANIETRLRMALGSQAAWFRSETSGRPHFVCLGFFTHKMGVLTEITVPPQRGVEDS